MAGCEIDFLPVGDGTKSGDAIAIRYGAPHDFKVMVVDGGTMASGKALVDHLRAVGGEGVVVEHAVCTHSDADHASGLRVLIEELPVKNLWVHQPWNYASELNQHFKGNWTEANLAYHLRHDCFSVVSDLCDLARSSMRRIQQLIPSFSAVAGLLTTVASLVSAFRVHL